MFGGKRLLSCLLAGVVAVSSLGVTAFAADEEEEEKKIMTFDGLHSMKDPVDLSSFYVEEGPDPDDKESDEEKVEKKIRRAAGVYDDDKQLTYEDLANVRSLDLSGMELVDVPSCINYMVKMTRLDLSSNLLRSEALKKLSLVGCTNLSSIDLSDNYLTNMPSWFVSDRVTNGNITKNFVDSDNPRGIKALITTYYLMDGETLNEDDLKNQILKSIRLNDGSLLPEYFFNYNPDSPYPGGGDYLLDFAEEWEPFAPDGKVVAPENKTVEVIIRLFNEADNVHTNTTVTIYLLSGKDLPSLKLRLEGLKKECDGLDEEAYTASSWESFTQAKDSAEAILEYKDADIQMLTNAFNALVKARDNLHYGTNELKDMLDGLIAVGGTYKEENYNPSSWAAFSEALERLKTIAADEDARLEIAQSAVKNFQRAQAALRSAELIVPNTIPKTDFEKIYGEDKNITASGVTVDGTSYKWTFYGKDLQEMADFNPEVKDTDATESKILLEAGSSSGYRMFATADTKALPGKATLEINVSDKLGAGDYYLYKWSGERSQMAGRITVADGKATIPLTEGGVYYLSGKIQNFELKSNTYKVDDDKKTVTIPPTNGVSAYDFKRTFEFANYTTILDADEKAVPSYMGMKPGMTINAPNMDKYKVLITGDADGSGGVDFEDVNAVIDAFLNGTEGVDSTMCDVDGDGSVTFEDVSKSISYFLMLV